MGRSALEENKVGHSSDGVTDDALIMRPAGLLSVFGAFLNIGLCGFGGGLVWAHRVVVGRRRWLSEQEFAELLSLAQFMPGPNIASLTVCIGARLRGLPGALVAL